MHNIVTGVTTEQVQILITNIPKQRKKNDKKTMKPKWGEKQ